MILRVDELVTNRAAQVPPGAKRRGGVGFRFHEAHLRLGRGVHSLGRNRHQRRMHFTLVFAHHVHDVPVAGRIHDLEHVLASRQGLAAWQFEGCAECEVGELIDRLLCGG